MANQIIHLGAGVYRRPDGSSFVVGSDGQKREMTGPGGAVNPPNPKQRFGDLKVPLGLVPSSAMVYAGLGHQDGAEKYGPFNWRETGVEFMTYAHAILRHLYRVIDGEWIDPESGKPHLGHLLASTNIVIDAYECGMLIDNRPNEGPAGDLLDEWKKEPAMNVFYMPDQSQEIAHRDQPLTSDVTDRMLQWLDEDMEEEPVAYGADHGAYDLNPRPLEEWHEDMGEKLWWCFPVSEPPYFGSPLWSNWPGYHTHFSDILVPKQPSPNPLPEKKPCTCQQGCVVDYGFLPAKGRFCCKAEAGE
jgi:hypothetical protein